jgi:proton-coupled amino acid transporter
MYHNHGNEPFDPSTLEDMPPAPEPPQPDGLDDSFMEPITDEQLVDILQQHLILGGEPMSCTPSQSSLHGAISVGSPRIDFDRTELEGVATPFHLPGTAVTNDIYKMANELVQRSLLVRSKSSTDLLEQRRQELQSDPALRNINKPGGFRRHFVQQQERHTPSVSEDGSSLRRYSSLMATDLDASDPINSSGTPYKKTRHFLEFLAVSHIGMFDNFAGEDLLDTDDDEEQARFVPLYRDEPVAGSTERTPLLRRKSSHMADLGTVTETKAVFLLLKAFVGSGVLFLPRAFSNGGLLFSFVSMWFMGGISLFSFLLLIDCKKYVSGSYGDVGGTLYGPFMRRLVLFSVAISQVQ